jgi:hypothetical protein
MVAGRCMKCKENREMKDTKFELNAKGRPQVRGKCTKCGTAMFKFLSTEEGLKHGLKVKTGKGVEGGSRKSRKSHGSRKSGGSRKSRKSAGSRKSRKGSRKSRSRKGSRKSRSRK